MSKAGKGKKRFLRIHGEDWLPYPGRRLVNRCGVVIYVGGGGAHNA